MRIRHFLLHSSSCLKIFTKGYEWIKVFYHNTEGGLFSSPEDALSKNVDDPNAKLFSILDKLEDYRSDVGSFHFRLCYPELVSYGDGCNEWTQKSNPATDSTISGFKPIKLSFTKNSYWKDWAGIGKQVKNSYYPTFIDDAPKEANWFTAIGAFSYWPSGKTIPCPRLSDSDTKLSAVTIVELYVKSYNIKIGKQQSLLID